MERYEHFSLSPISSEKVALLIQDTGDLRIVAPQQVDANGTEAWKSYLDKEELLVAWSTPFEPHLSKQKPSIRLRMLVITSPPAIRQAK